MVNKITPDAPDGDKTIPISARECGAFVSTGTMEQFIATFERSTRRWELVVYPALFAFMVLAAYGFYLVFSLTRDMRVIASSIDNNVGTHIETLATNMNAMSDDVNAMSLQIKAMTSHVEVMATRMDSLETLEPMLTEIRSLDSSISRLDSSVANISVSTDLIQRDMQALSYNVGRPASRFNRFMP